MSEQAHIDCLAFAQDSRKLESVIAVRDFTRLCKSLTDSSGEIHYRIETGLEKSGRAFMRLEASGQLQLQCQRCMQDFGWNLATNSLVYIARNVVQLDLWDRQADGLEDAVLADSEFDWFAWLEDELLLSLPAAPIHRAEVCPTDRTTQKASRPNPFAVLATLKQHQKLKS
ncbi:MAG: YceD family protein [Sulfuriferula sp.]